MNKLVNSLGTLLLDSTKNNMDQTALEINNIRITYQQLFYSSAFMIERLLSMKTEHVAILLSKSVNSYRALYASVIAGKAYMPLSPTSRMKQLLHMMESTKTKIMMVDQETYELAKLIQLKLSFSSEIIVIDEASNQHVQTVTLTNYAVPNTKNAYIMFTSGSTGKPKAIKVGHPQVLHYLSAMIERYKPTKKDKFSQVIELTFDLSVHDIFLAWAVGACVTVFTGTNYFQLANYLEKNKPSFWLSVPTTGMGLERTNLLTKKRFESLRYVLFCGEPLPTTLANKWHRAAPNAKIENIYGPTEATIAFTAYSFTKNEQIKNKIVPIGKALPGLITNVVREDLSTCACNEVGELLLGGPQLVDGYFGQPLLTKDKFIHTSDGVRWYRTGDFAYQDDNQNLHFKGRIDDQLQIQGQRIERLDLELQFREILNNNNLYLIPSPITEEGLVLGIALIYISSDAINEESIKKLCKQNFQPPLLPSIYIAVDSLPVNLSGKVDYQKLKQLYQIVLSRQIEEKEYV